MGEKNITTRQQDYSQWYLDVIARADLAENSTVRGCMVIKPYGFAIWEEMRDELNRRIKDSGAQNAYFPIFIPKSFLSKEASHVKGFAKECAVVTHYRLKATQDGNGVEVDPEAKLEEELIVRPTSETIMYDAFSRWVTSWRDLPLKINQWANIVRWEKRTRLFLRTTEFLWQEGHTVHTTHEEALSEVKSAIDIYVKFAKEYLALAVYAGKKSQSEKFAGALDTYGVEAMMQDGKGLQFGTSHDLGQNFAKVFGIQFADKDGEVKTPWQTSWGVSTRMIGAIIMAHSDDSGLVLPPNIAPIKVVIVPIYQEENKELVLNYAKEIYDSIKERIPSAKLDDRDFVSPGFKFNEWEKKGVPVRIEVGPRDVESNSAVLVRRDSNENSSVDKDNIDGDMINSILEKIQSDLYNRSLQMLERSTYEVSNYEEFKEKMSTTKGFIKAYWCGESECEDGIKHDTKATTRCMVSSEVGEVGVCIHCGKQCHEKWLFAQSY